MPSTRRLVLAAALASAACHKPDPNAILEVSDVEAYWAVDPSVGQTQYIAPVVRFHLRNKSPESQAAIQVTATFRRRGEEDRAWGTDGRAISSSKRPLAAGETTLVVLKSDARYYSTGVPESMFQHTLFRDARVEFFARVGPSDWTRLGEAAVERRIGSRQAQATPPGK